MKDFFFEAIKDFDDSVLTKEKWLVKRSSKK